MGRRTEQRGQTVELNQYGQQFVNQVIGGIDEDKVYASIGAYDPEAFAAYLQNETERITKIALEHQNDPEFQHYNQSIGR